MKSRWLPIFAFGGIAVFACSTGSPDIELSEQALDIGQVVNGEIINFEVIVRNIGSTDLQIQAVTTSCGCTTASIVPEVIPGGGAGVLSISYDSGAHGPSEVGSIIRQVFITSNDPDESDMEFRFTAEVTPAEQ